MALELYERVGDFSDDEVTNKGGRTSVDAAQLDAELDAIKAVLDDARLLLSIIQRDDGKLGDDILQGHEFSAASVSALGALLSTGSLIFRGEWAASTDYAANDVVSVTGTGSFICVTAHTSPGTFVEAPNWQKLAADGGAGDNGVEVVQVNTNLVIDASHSGKCLEVTGTRSLTLPAVGSTAADFWVIISAAPSGATVVVNCSGADTIDGSASIGFVGVANANTYVVLRPDYARTTWRIFDARIASGTSNSLVLWADGLPSSSLAPGSIYQDLSINSVGNPAYLGNQISALHASGFTVAVATDHKNVERVDASSGDVTVSLPAAAGVVAGFRTTIFKTDSTNNKVIIDGNGSETINGQLTVTLCIQYEFVTLVFDGGGWLVVEDGRKTLFGTNTLNLAATTSGYFDVANPFGSDDVDFGGEVYGSLALTSGGRNVSATMTAPDKRTVTLFGTTTSSPFATNPASGYIRVYLVNNHSATQDVTIKYWIRRRSA